MAAGFANMGGQPILIVPEGTLRSSGKDAQRNNIAAAKAVADAVRTTLGPKGMDKMLVDSLGDVVITNDGATILEEMKIEHPAAKMLVEVAKTQDKEVGDGTTTAVVLAGEFLKQAEALLDQEIHPSVITKGYRLAKNRAIDELNKLAKDVKDDAALIHLAETAMTGKSAEVLSKELAEIAVKAVRKIGAKSISDYDDVKIEKKAGGSIGDTVLIEGVIIDKEVVHSGMPRRIENAKIALIDTEFEIKKTGADSKIEIDSTEKFQAFLDAEEKMLKDMVVRVTQSGANVVFCQKGIEDLPQHFLAKAGVLATRRVSEKDMKMLAKATGAKIVNNLKELSKDDLGFAGVVYEKKVAGDNMLFVEKCKEPKAVTILIRGGTEHVADEIQRAMVDAVKSVMSALELGKIVPGGGAPEIAVARAIRKYAESFKGREQLAVKAFADALEIIPRSLAENAGLDPIDSLASLRMEHDKGNSQMGINIETGGAMDMYKAGIIEPLKTKLQAIKSASEATEMILRIDDMISASKSAGPPAGMGGGGMPPGMGGMGEF